MEANNIEMASLAFFTSSSVKPLSAIPLRKGPGPNNHVENGSTWGVVVGARFAREHGNRVQNRSENPKAISVHSFSYRCCNRSPNRSFCSSKTRFRNRSCNLSLNFIPSLNRSPNRFYFPNRFCNHFPHRFCNRSPIRSSKRSRNRLFKFRSYTVSFGGFRVPYERGTV